jgi:nitrate reductase molybdenum cofactor assembly chaperone NarJ/NarW
MSERAQRLCYQAVSQLLDYPGAALTERLPLLRTALGELPRDLAAPLAPLVEHLEVTDETATQAEYVETFDLRRRCSLYLTYYAYGDTRKRGQALLSFKHAYRKAGMVLEDGELPDHLCVVLEFGATADLAAARQLLVDHRAGLELLGIALRDADSPYAGAVAAVSSTLPKLRGDETEAVRKLIAQGPPGEEVGLEPFAPPDYMGARR